MPILDLVTVEDWGEGRFAKGVGILTPHPACAPNLYLPSIQLQSKMAALKTWFIYM